MRDSSRKLCNILGDQPVSLPAQQEQDALVKFSGCTMSAEIGPSSVPLVQDREMPAPALARTDLVPVPTTLSALAHGCFLCRLVVLSNEE